MIHNAKDILQAQEKIDNLQNLIDDFRKKSNSRVFPFGKYKGKTIQWVITNDIDYIYWFVKNVSGHPEFNLDYIEMGIPTYTEKLENEKIEREKKIEAEKRFRELMIRADEERRAREEAAHAPNHSW